MLLISFLLLRLCTDGRTDVLIVWMDVFDFVIVRIKEPVRFACAVKYSKMRNLRISRRQYEVTTYQGRERGRERDNGPIKSCFVSFCANTCVTC